MKKNILLLIVISFGFSVSVYSQSLSPKIKSLIDKTNSLTYSNKNDSALTLVLQFLEGKNLSAQEIFYGQYLCGDILKSSGKEEDAIKQLSDSKKYLVNVPDKIKYESLIDGNIAECYFDLLNYDDAKKYAQLSIETNPDSSLRSGGHAVNYTILGYCYYDEKNYPAALHDYNLAMKEYIASGETCELPLCYMKIGKVYNRMGNQQLAIDYVNKGIAISDSCKIEGYILLSKRTLFDIYQDNKNYKQALTLLEEINDLVAKIENEKQDQAMSGLEVKYKTMLVQKENESLQKINVKKEEILVKQKQELIITVSAILILLLLVIFLIRISNQRKKAEEKLVVVNAALEQKVLERTEHLKEANEKIKENATLLTFQNAQLVDFCNIISHNLRSPLGNMSKLIDMIEKSNDATEQKLILEKLKPVINSLNETFNELVESLQIKQDLEIKHEKIFFYDCLKRTLDGLQGEINESHASIESDFSDAPAINYPSKYLFSIFQNLLSNALKYKSPERKPSIKIKSRSDNGKIILSVTDNSLGIDLKKFGDKIFRIRKVFHEHPDAKGFGLYITKTQVETMGGKIWVESTPNVGSTFFIEFANQG